MDKLRGPFQGVANIIRFNWHFYVASLGLVSIILIATLYINDHLVIYSYIICCLIAGSIVLSLSVSHYIYDRSGLYDLRWLGDMGIEGNKIVNINAGFDETSHLIKARFENSTLIVLDFYDPLKHTEVSIKRARKAYPPFVNTIYVATDTLPLATHSVETILVMFAAHEIRDETERIDFFKELCRIAKPNGQILVTEHLRDFQNFVVYNIGFFHFYSRSTWHKVFHSAQLKVQSEIKCTPFISTFVLKSNGDAS